MLAARRWSVAVFSSRETSDTLSSSIEAVIDALAGVPTSIDVIVNGNRQLANETGKHVQSLRVATSAPISIRVWHIVIADKAHAWNKYLHEIWPGSEVAFFVDGYVRVMPDALALLSDGLAATPKALAASGVPNMGRSANLLRERMQREGGGHGNLHALRGNVCSRLRERGFRLPLGTYWTDGLLLGVICFDLDPARNEWDVSRILRHPQATWAFRPLAWWRPADVRSHWNRIMRQARGSLENLAIREHLHIQRKTPESLPRTVSELVESWLDAFPSAARAIFIRKPLCLVAARKLRHPRDWSQTALPPELVAQVVLPPEE
jgi:hypothetical protein